MLMEWRIKTLNKKHHFLIKHDTKYSRKRLLLTLFQKTPKFNFHHPHFSKKKTSLKRKNYENHKLYNTANEKKNRSESLSVNGPH